MNATEFCYWLQGYIEVTKAGQPPGNSPLMRTLNQAQLDTIERHLALVFQHDIDPKQGPPAVQQQLQTIHDGPSQDQVLRPNPYVRPRPVFRC